MRPEETAMQHSSDSLILDREADSPAHRVHAGPLVQALQRDLIPRLARAHRPALLHVTPGEVDAFTAELLDGDDRALLARLGTLRQRSFSNEDLCLDLLAPAAQRLGALWNDDRCDFTGVAIGVGQLQRLMRLLGPHAVPTAASPGAGLRVLLARAPSEQHSFGLTMVAEFFRSAGWDVAGVGGAVEEDVVERASVQHVDVVGFSVGGETQLDWLAAQIPALRRASRNPQVVVMLGGPFFALQPQRAADLGADLCVPDARRASGLAVRRVRAAH